VQLVTAALLIVAAAGPPAAVPPPPSPAAVAAPAPSPAPYCSGEYADELLALSPAARARDDRGAPYTYCVRSTATYECPSYGSDGTLRTTRRKVTSHGTAFGLRPEGGGTLLVTNDHVSEWTAVTDEERAVEGVPAGCRRVASAVRIVDDESDAYERDDVPLARVVSDPELDVSVLRSKTPLETIPWRLGRSAALRERNAVDVRGFPLGALRAHNVGKVISTGRHDEDNGWSHEDFVVDALLSPGNSGSPVLAVSCATGELELVGVYHARYTRANALHTVVGVDQLRELLATLKRSAREPRVDVGDYARAIARGRLLYDARAAGQTVLPFGPVVAAVRARDDGALLFQLLSRDYPVQEHAAVVLEDLPTDGPGFGDLGRIWAGNRQGLAEVTRAAKSGGGAELWQRVLEALRRDALLALDYRDQARAGTGSRELFQESRKLERALRQATAAHKDLAQSALEAGEQLCPRFGEAELTLRDLLVAPARGAAGDAPARGADVASRLPLSAAPPGAASRSERR
jgi:serine protease Do